jgi:hypothetical protein
LSAGRSLSTGSRCGSRNLNEVADSMKLPLRPGHSRAWNLGNTCSRCWPQRSSGVDALLQASRSLGQMRALTGARPPPAGSADSRSPMVHRIQRMAASTAVLVSIRRTGPTSRLAVPAAGRGRATAMGTAEMAATSLEWAIRIEPPTPPIRPFAATRAPIRAVGPPASRWQRASTSPAALLR